MYAWGDPEYGGSIPEETKAALDAASGISRLVGGEFAFAVWTMEGECLVWGHNADMISVHLVRFAPACGTRMVPRLRTRPAQGYQRRVVQ